MMKTLRENPVAIGVIAGALSALLMVAGQSVAMFSALLLTLAFSAIIAAGLSAGAAASAIAVLVASGLIAAFFSSQMAFVNMLLTLAPAALMSYLANFARPAEEIGGPTNAMAWYPLSDMLLYAAIAVALSSYLVLALNPMRDALAGEIFNQVKLMMQEMSPGLPIDTDVENLVRSLISIILPLSQSAQLLVIIFAAYYFAVRILNNFNLGVRPREDIPTALRMHPVSSILMLSGLAAIFVDGEIGIAGANIAGAFAAGFILSGFAVFHMASRGKSWRLPGLILAYLATALFSIPALAFLVVGMLYTRRSIAISPRSKPNNPET